MRRQEAKEWRRCPMDRDETGSEEEAKRKFKQKNENLPSPCLLSLLVHQHISFSHHSCVQLAVVPNKCSFFLVCFGLF